MRSIAQNVRSRSPFLRKRNDNELLSNIRKMEADEATDQEGAEEEDNPDKPYAKKVRSPSAGWHRQRQNRRQQKLQLQQQQQQQNSSGRGSDERELSPDVPRRDIEMVLDLPPTPPQARRLSSPDSKPTTLVPQTKTLNTRKHFRNIVSPAAARAAVRSIVPGSVRKEQQKKALTQAVENNKVRKESDLLCLVSKTFSTSASGSTTDSAKGSTVVKPNEGQKRASFRQRFMRKGRSRKEEPVVNNSGTNETITSSQNSPDPLLPPRGDDPSRRTTRGRSRSPVPMMSWASSAVRGRGVSPAPVRTRTMISPIRGRRGSLDVTGEQGQRSTNHASDGTGSGPIKSLIQGRNALTSAIIRGKRAISVERNPDGRQDSPDGAAQKDGKLQATGTDVAAKEGGKAADDGHQGKEKQSSFHNILFRFSDDVEEKARVGSDKKTPGLPKPASIRFARKNSHASHISELSTPYTPDVRQESNQSLTETSFRQIRDALGKVEKQLRTSKEAGKSVSRPQIMRALMEVAEHLDSNEDREVLKREISNISAQVDEREPKNNNTTKDNTPDKGMSVVNRGIGGRSPTKGDETNAKKKRASQEGGNDTNSSGGDGSSYDGSTDESEPQGNNIAGAIAGFFGLSGIFSSSETLDEEIDLPDDSSAAEDFRLENLALCAGEESFEDRDDGRKSYADDMSATDSDTENRSTSTSSSLEKLIASTAAASRNRKKRWNFSSRDKSDRALDGTGGGGKRQARADKEEVSVGSIESSQFQAAKTDPNHLDETVRQILYGPKGSRILPSYMADEDNLILMPSTKQKEPAIKSSSSSSEPKLRVRGLRQGHVSFA